MVRRRAAHEEVINAARPHCEVNGWPWREPVRVTRTVRGFRVWTNADICDDNPWFVVSRGGRVTDAGWARLHRSQ
jgi:hypothetical protein